jgi:CYTH domain-containing protein
MSRFEWEKIPIEEAEKLLLLCEKESSTNRFEVKIGNHTYEVDFMVPTKA